MREVGAIHDTEDTVYDLCWTLHHLGVLSAEKVVQLDDSLYYYWLHEWRKKFGDEYYKRDN